VISHDRYFLDHVTGRTLDMAFGRLEDYPAPYQKYLELKAERLELQLKQYQAQQEYIAKTEEFIRRFKAGQRTKEARGREKILNRLKYGYQGANHEWVNERIDRPEQQKKLAIRMDTQIRSGDMALKLDKLQVGYPPEAIAHQNGHAASGSGRVLIKAPDLEMQRGQRVALMGPNGSGKTTLLRTLVGELPPLRGLVRLGHRVEINYYAQSHEGLRMDASVLEEIRRIRPLIKETEARTLLGRFLFSGDDVYKRVGDLSGGERSRVALAQLTLLGGNLLVLDEPTNHLDINAREALETVLNEYNGSILFVSHDRYFIDAVADTIWTVKDGSIEKFDGNYSEYAAFTENRESRAESQREPATDSKEQRTKNKEQSSNGHKYGGPSVAAPVGKEDRKRQRRLAALEQEIAMLEGELKQIEADMNAAGQAADRKRVTSLGIQYAEIQEMLNTRYEEWTAVAS
jgi:ATP-binding cassette subfamily F protein 3